MIRFVGRELLDHLDPLDPEAIGSRRDLVRLNSWMGNARALAGALDQVLKSGRRQKPRVADIGSGDGLFILKVARLLARRGWGLGELVLVDKLGIVPPTLSEDLGALAWKTSFIRKDVFAWAEEAGGERFDAVIANLFLHHFEDDQLRDLFAALAAKTRAVIAVEPKRSRHALALTKLLFIIGCNRVTRHDAALSVRAGFTGKELSALWPVPGWDLCEDSSGIAGHIFKAVLRSNEDD